MEREYKLKMSDTFRKMSAIYFIVGLWTTKAKPNISWKIYVFLLLLSCTLSIAVKACITDDNDEFVFLSMTTFICIVQNYRLYYIIWKQHKIIDLMYTSSASSTDDYESYCKVNWKLINFMTFVKYFLISTCSSFIVVTFFPLVKRELLFKIAFPFDYTNDESAFYIAHVYVTAAFGVSVLCCLAPTFIWYIMLNIVVKLDLLGSDFRRLGVVRTEEPKTNSLTKRRHKQPKSKQTLYTRDLIEAIKNFDNIYECATKVFIEKTNRNPKKPFHWYSPMKF